MKMRKLLAGVVGATMLMSTVAFADVTTTTTYNASSGTVDVRTEVSEITNGSMVTYVLYGAKDSTTNPFGTNGSINNTTESTPTESNIIYIDQVNNVTNTTAVFTATGLTVGEAYGSKVIVGTDTSADEAESTVADGTYTGDMYTLTIDTSDAETDGYTVDIDVSMGTGYEYEATLTASNASAKVPVGAECTVTFVATDSSNVISASSIDGTAFTNGSNLNPDNFVKDTTYTLSADVEAGTQAPLITVSEPIVGTNQVSYLVNVEYFDNVLNTGLKIDIVDGDTVLHTFDNLVPVQVGDGEKCYAIRIKDDTTDSKLNMPDVTNGYKVTPFIRVNGSNIYAGATSEGDTNHFTYELNADSSYTSDSTEDIPETLSDGLGEEGVSGVDENTDTDSNPTEESAN